MAWYHHAVSATCVPARRASLARWRFLLAIALLWLLTAPCRAERLTLKVWNLPLKESRDIGNRARWAIVERFMELHPDLKVEGFRGLEAPGLQMEVGPLLAIAGGVAPDVLYVNFRISDSYIQQKFLYPLDDYVARWRKEEDLSERIYPPVWNVIKREGHIWAIPYGTLVMALVYRKDLFREAGLDPNRPPRNWDELFEYAKRLTKPEKGQYGMALAGGPQASWFFINFLWSAGGEVVRQDKGGQWRAVFNDAGAVRALKFYQRLTREPWTRGGKTYRGVAYRGQQDMWVKWSLGQIGMNFMYLSDDLMMNVNPNVVGIAPVPRGPTGLRGSELNCTMMGINATIKDPRVRDAAWRYIRFNASEEAQRIKTRVYVEGGYAKFIVPKYLRRFGYERYLREVPPGWEATLEEALTHGRPEPYGRNCEMIYVEMTPPLDAVTISDRTDYQALLDAAVGHTNERMIGIIPPRVQARRLQVAAGAVAALVIIFTLLFRQVFRSFSADVAAQEIAAERAPAGRRWLRHWRKYWPAYLILLPALGSVAVWQYYPLARGSLMAFQDYRLVAKSHWVGLENFSHVLFEPRFWKSLMNSLLYMSLALGLGFFSPILLALMLHEVPRGKVFFRTLYYLPAVTTGLVIMFLWKQFYEPTEHGLLNRLLAMVHVPPQTWLNDPRLAMLSVVLPIVWAGVGPACIIYLAALKSIPEEYYEAADLDGAGIWPKVRHITIPYLKPLIIINFVGAFVAAFRSFDFIFAMTGGGPLFATHVVGLEIWYNAFLYLHFGYAVAAAWILGSLLVGFTVMQLRILSRIQFRTAEA